MKQFTIASIALGIIILSIYSCAKKTTTIDLNLGKEYYPLVTGRSITYKVDSTIYDDFTGLVFQTHSYIKDVVDTQYLDIQNNPAFYVKRYYKSDSATDFTFSYMYTALIINNRLEIVYDNLRYIKLVFPVTYLGTWKGNEYINTSSSKEPYAWIDDKPYSYKDLGKPYTNDSLTFPNTLTVFHINEIKGDSTKSTTTFGDITYSSEKYGKNIGLIYKEVKTIKKDPVIGGGRWKGFEVKINCIAFD
jgi:hypothetical protein